jgi:exonuclease III
MSNFLKCAGIPDMLWNDLADALAKHVLTHPDAFPAINFGRLHDLVKEPHDLEWVWTQGLSPSMKHCFPNCVQNTVWQFSPSMRRVELPPTTELLSSAPVAFACKIATINVLALDKIDSQTEVGRRTGSRTLRLDHQLHAAKFHMVGLQETRTLQGQFQSEHYHILSSGCVGPSAARFGCELWLHRSLPILTLPDGRPVTMTDCTSVVTHADPRRLFVRLEHQTFHLTAVVLHAPCLGKSTGDATSPIDAVRSWWAETSQLWHHQVDSGFVCVFVDANATLASEPTQYFQDHHADAISAQSLVFEEFLVEHALYVPATFAALHQGPSYTWTHSSGKRMRLDYVLLNGRMFEMVTKSETWLSYDGTFTHEDHIPACLELSGWLPCQSRPEKIVWDEHALLDLVRCKAFQDALVTLPVPTWEVSVDAHCQVYEAQYFQLAKQFFSKAPGRRKRPTLSAETLSAIGFKRHLLDCGRSWHLMTHGDFREELKAVETQVRKLVNRDLQIFYDQLLVQLQDAGHVHDHKQMFRALTRLGGKRHKRPSAVKPLPMLRDSAGQLVTSYAHQFAAIEAGVPVSRQALMRADSSGLGLALDLPEACSFPSSWQLHEAVSKLKREDVCLGPMALPRAS